MIPYTVGNLAPNSTHFTRGLVKYIPRRGYFRAVPSQNGDKFATSHTPPVVERLYGLVARKLKRRKKPFIHSIGIQTMLQCYTKVALLRNGLYFVGNVRSHGNDFTNNIEQVSFFDVPMF